MTETRAAVVARLATLATSPRYADRADTGRALALFVERPEAVATLGQLLVDESDTFVTLATASALFRRYDIAGLEVVCRALAGADDNTAQYIYDAAQEVFGVWGQQLVDVRTRCASLADHAEAKDRSGASLLASDLSNVQRVLRPDK